jgi:Glycosyl hydrolases family 16
LVGALARFDYLSARPRNHASQVGRSPAVTFLWFAAMRRTSGDVEDRLDVTELIERIAAERGLSIEDTDRHPVVAQPAVRRPRRRRLAPVIVGVSTVLVVATIALGLRAGGAAQTGPDLNAALVGAAAPSANPVPAKALATIPPPAAASAAPTTAAPAPASPSATTASRSATVRSGAPKPVPAKPATNDSVQAATAGKWKLIDRDEFTGTVSERWGKYDGSGNAGKGRRTAAAITVRDGAAVIRGDEDGNTGGLSWRDDRRTGRWEMRAKFPKGDAQYHPVLLLWPEKRGSDDGEVDFAETTSASNSVSFFLHHGSGDQKSAKKQIDITQWHNYAVEVTPKRVTGYLDGQKWFESTDPDTLPGDAVHPVIQLDWFPKGDSHKPTELLVDWMRVYE